FREGSVGDDDAPVGVAQRDARLRGLESFAALEVTVGAELFVIGEAAIHHRLSLGFRESGEGGGIDVTEADVFHDGVGRTTPGIGRRYDWSIGARRFRHAREKKLFELTQPYLQVALFRLGFR